MNRFVIVSGLPASGKSTLARAVAQALALPVLDKDDFLEAMFERGGTDDAHRRRELSQTADEVLRKQVEQSDGAIVASWWKHPQSPDDSGTPIEWLTSLPGLRVEIYCRCDPAIAARRFTARRRHPGHLDGRWSAAELIARFARQASLGPLGVGHVVEVRTEHEVDLDPLVRGIARAFEETRQEPTGGR